MTARVLDGTAVAKATLDRVRGEVAEFVAAHGRAPVLATVLVGDDSTSCTHMTADRCAAVGMTSRHVELAAPVTTGEVAARVRELSADPDVDGILVRHPMPAGIDARTVFDAIDPAKDVDGVTSVSFARMALGEPGFVAAPPGGIMALLDAYEVRLPYRYAVIVGRSPTLGRPLGMLLLARDVTVTYCHSHTIDLAAHIAEADLLITATGRPGLIPGKWIRQGAIVVDAGAGDVEFDAAAERASLITPVPGGVGPMTIATLLAQTIRAARER
ncbi:MAG TPA: bifunctional 5,10-methylenetetrahydrofolate dehydrogenase/5,10-methenyltetrahydrofolate cyclohydrolase [Actinophytocola sp.]|uniref:bifunctional 5,10-methylenetetrahydrofolate dehydrogenase/5,10-methenyltetrahydrofolate cyclohydrolase n=1 Tax=Actinophytocola sp. TaxID=1872138 RepID=UPI002DDCBB20|nr:bifunctional 5,10-methylenetetrahydrofolate dehydrogenase/5,10-methenyltetrahydrofolate cyclohydrolase [Actinophytocola sp.]HEV2778980.1 bifunctional 5,10-methylenetetrahydrofolate dehydrogenase/5,10-methenyltetrahydrofolate cyclohydrolase [Actinophytocola sp.]